MADVFISYARQDAARVDGLVAALELDGFDVWIDRKDVRPGHRFFLEIEKALDASACVLVCWSVNATQSSFVYDEVTEVADQGKLVPVRFDDVAPPLGLRSLRFLDLLGWDAETLDHPGLQAVKAEIRKRVSVPRLVSTATEGFKISKAYPADFEMQFSHAASQLEEELSFRDAEFDYSQSWFTPLEAEVEIRKGDTTSERRLTDLLSAITEDAESRLFLVLGDPGSGKSVAMRELARHGLRA